MIMRTVYHRNPEHNPFRGEQAKDWDRRNVAGCEWWHRGRLVAYVVRGDSA